MSAEHETRGTSLRRGRLIARRELLERVQQRAYKITLFVGALLAVAGVVGPSLLGGSDDAPEREQVPVLIQGASQADSGARIKELNQVAKQVRGASLKFEAARSAEAVQKAVRDGDSPLGAVITGTASQPALTLVLREDGGGATADAVAQSVDRAGVQARLTAAGAPAGTLDPVPVKAQIVAGGGPDGTTTAVVLAMALVIYLGGLLLVPTFATGLVTDRTNHVTERLLTAAKPLEHLVGKLVGVGAAGILQFAFWVVAAIVASLVLDGTGSNSILSDVPLSLLLYFPVAFLLTYLLYGALASLLVLPVRKTEDVSGSLSAAVTLQVVAFIVATTIIAPGAKISSTIEILSLVPFFSPILMLARLGAGDVAAWEVAVAVIGPIVVAVVLLKIVAPAYARYAIEAPGGKSLKAAIAAVRG